MTHFHSKYCYVDGPGDTERLVCGGKDIKYDFQRATPTVWVYYETDGDAGWYGVKLFPNKIDAERYKKLEDSAYGKIEEMRVEEPLPFEEEIR